MISISEIQQLRKNKQAMKDQAKELKDPVLQKETEGTTTVG